MSDIAKCMDSLCPSKDFCHRFTAPASEFWQSYGNFNRESDEYNCDMFWHNGICKHCHQNPHKPNCPIKNNKDENRN